MKKSKVIIAFFIVLLQSCSSKTKECYECFTPPESFIFEIIDKSTGENVFTNGTYSIDDIAITNTLNNNETVDFNLITENVNLIEINSIGWQTEKVNLRFTIDNKDIFDFYVDVERNSRDCCSFSEFNEISILNSDFELDTDTGLYKIFLE